MNKRHGSKLLRSTKKTHGIHSKFLLVVFFILFAGMLSYLQIKFRFIGNNSHPNQIASIRLPINARTLAWHPDSRTLAVGGWSGMLSIWNARTGELIRDLKQPNNAEIGEIQYSRGKDFLAVGKSTPGSKQPYLIILDASNYQVIDKLDSPKMLEDERANAGLNSLSIDPAGSGRIALSSYISGKDPVIFSTGHAPRKLIQTVPESPYFVEKVTFSPTGESIAVGRMHGSIEFYAAENGRLINSITAFGDDWWIRDMIFSPDGKFIFAASNTGAGKGSLDKATGKWHDRKNNEPIKMWDVKTRALVRIFDTQGKDIKSLDTSPDGLYLIVGLSNGEVVIWDVLTGTEVKRFQPSTGYSIVKLSPDGKWLATTDTGTSVVKIWSFLD